LDPKKAESSLAGVKIGIRQPPMQVLAGRLREKAEEVEDFAKGNKTTATVLFFSSTGKSELLSTAWWDEPMADCLLKVETNLDWAAIVEGGCIGFELYQVASNEVLGQVTPGIDLGYLRTMKKKRPRRGKKER